MKLNNEINPVTALATRSFLICVGPNTGCRVFFNHTNDNIKITAHLVNAVSNNGIVPTVN